MEEDAEDKTGLMKGSLAYVYAAVWLALVALTFLTVWSGKAHAGGIGSLAPFVIAMAKALLVLAFFMHLRYEGRFLRSLPALAAVVMVSVLLLVLSDIAYRG